MARYTQEEGLDFLETFFLCPNFITIRCLLSFAVVKVGICFN